MANVEIKTDSEKHIMEQIDDDSSICTGICETCTLDPCPNWQDLNCAAAGR